MTKRHSSANPDTDREISAILLNEIKDQSELTGQQISDATKVHPPMVSRYLMAKTQPSIAKLSDMVDALGYRLAIFVDGNEVTVPVSEEEIETLGSEQAVHSHRLAASTLNTILDTKGMTKMDVRKATDVSYALLSNYVNSKVQPSVPQLMKLSRGLDLKVEFAVFKTTGRLAVAA